MKELEEMGLMWGEAQAMAQNRIECQHLIKVLCPSRDKEVEYWVGEFGRTFA